MRPAVRRRSPTGRTAALLSCPDRKFVSVILGKINNSTSNRSEGAPMFKRVPVSTLILVFTLAVFSSPSALAQAPSVSFVADPPTIVSGDSTRLRWTVTNANPNSVDIGGVGQNLPLTGSSLKSPTQTTTYVLQATGPGGSTTAQAKVTVLSRPTLTVQTADPSTITLGGSSVLRWTSNGTKVTIEGSGCTGCSNLPGSGSKTVTPAETTTYEVTAFAADGGFETKKVKVTVTVPQVNIGFTVAPVSITEGETARLTWAVTPTDLVVSIDNGVGAVEASGARDLRPLVTTTYTLKAMRGTTVAGQATASITVNPIPLPLQASITAVPESVRAGQTFSLVWSSTGATSGTVDGVGVEPNGSSPVVATNTHTYTFAAMRGSERVTASTTVTVLTVPPPTVTFTALPSTSNPDQPVILSWDVTGGDPSVSIDNGIGDVLPSARRTVTPKRSTIYTLTAIGEGGRTTKTAQVTVKTPPAKIVTTSGSPETAGSTDGDRTTALFNQPAAVAVDGIGNLYVIDGGNHTIRKVDASGRTVTWLGQANTKGLRDGHRNQALFDFTGFSGGFLVYPDGSMDVRDKSNKRRIVDKDGNVTTCVQLSCARMRSIGMVADSANNLYEAESGAHVIIKTTPAGVTTVVAGQRGVAGFDNGSSGAATFNEPRGLVIDKQGNLYVGDAGNNAIRKITSTGAVTTLATGFAFGCCGGTMAIDAGGNLYVADADSNTIKRVSTVNAAPTVETLVGSGDAGSADGEGNQASFRAPTGVAIGDDGDIIVSDTNNHTIRTVTPPAGTPRRRAVRR
jgi:hypothetical protein